MYTRRLGEVGLALMSVVLGVWALREDWPWWLVGGFFLLAVALATLALMGTEGSPAPESTFIRGDASGSTFDSVLVKGAHTFIGGSARDASFRNVLFRRGRRR